MDNSPALKKANAGSAKLESSNFPELAQMYQSSFQLPLSNATTSVNAYNTAQTVQHDNAVRAQAQQHAQDLADPNKYQVIRKQDGGFSFVAPNGQEVSAKDYADLRGATPDQVLRGSQNPIDIQYLTDFDNLQKFLQAVTSGDKTATDTYYKSNPGLQKLSPQEVITQFQHAYPTVYGYHKAGQPLGSTNIPTVSGGGSAVDSLLAGLLSSQNVTPGK